jgi:hypothetical protein
MSESRDGSGGRSARWLRRQVRKERDRRRIKKHGVTLRRVYVDAVRKRVRKLENK